MTLECNLTWSLTKFTFRVFECANKSQYNFEAAEKKPNTQEFFHLLKENYWVKNVDQLHITLSVRYKLSKTANPAATPPSSDEETFVRIK